MKPSFKGPRDAMQSGKPVFKGGKGGGKGGAGFKPRPTSSPKPDGATEAVGGGRGRSANGEGAVATPGGGRGRTAKPEEKRKREPRKELKFDVRGRFEFLNGFQKRKEERKKKGNLKNLKKEQKRKREEASSYRNHIQSEYDRTISAVRHNYHGDDQPVDAEETSTNVIAEETVYYPPQEADPFGEVCIHITSLESPQFVKAADLAQQEDDGEEGAEKKPSGPKPVAGAAGKTNKKTPTFVKFKQLTKSSQFLLKRKKTERTKKMSGLKRVKSTTKPSKKNGKGKKKH